MKYAVILDVEKSIAAIIDIPVGHSIKESVVRVGYKWEDVKDVLPVGEKDELLDPDPDYPYRPQTLDFARLSRAAQDADEQATSGQSISSIMGIDSRSLGYVMHGRAMIANHQTEDFSVGWLDGFAIGKTYQERGGHRDAAAYYPHKPILEV